MNDTALSIETQFFEAAFQSVLEAEVELAETIVKLQEATTLLAQAKNGAEKRLADAWKIVEDMMKEGGEIERIMPGDVMDYCIKYSTPRLGVDVPDADAVPDEFVKIERTPKKKEIAEALKSGAQFNWATMKEGESKLMWKALKKTTKE